jgi:hypothetical protein
MLVRIRRNFSLREYSPFPQGMTGGLDRPRLIQPTVAFGRNIDIAFAKTHLVCALCVVRCALRVVRCALRVVRCALRLCQRHRSRLPRLQPPCTLTSIHRVKKSYGPWSSGIECCSGTDAAEWCAKDEEGRHRWFQCS